ncbi:tetratricopeptide repeat-containing protein 13 [Elsinoe australis]|uniref:Tetratricopeptide repeat-containing protein 13 n=1 Tax=Elsinoe australis TaxID=40998 RepID=A0A4U7AS50_9PEZI|nr:tetratricopeptide repeat-containing protein 13 [Elsinoe australis]
MSLRQEIETWVSALKHYDGQEYDAALYAFEQIADTSKILFNCGIIHATLGEHGRAVDCYSRSTQLDQYLAIAYFQQGVSNFLMGDFEEALANFNDTLLYLRGNRYIDYSQLGLKFKLHSCEALFNRGLCYYYLQQREAAMSDLLFASQEKAVPDHNVIDEAIKERAEGYTVFSIPVGIVYRPNEAKVKNLRTKDYLGRARLIAQQQNNRHERRQLSAQDLSSSLAFDGDGSYAAMHLVKPGLSSRNRQQSEPPLHRAVFPPTPPPEMDRPLSLEETHKATPQPHSDLPLRPAHQRRSSETTTTSPSQSTTSLRRPPNKPTKLDLSIAAFSQSPAEHQSPPHFSNAPSTRRPTAVPRSASERPSNRCPAPSNIDTSFSFTSQTQVQTQAQRPRDRLSLLDPPRHGQGAEGDDPASSPEQLAPVTYRGHRRSLSGGTMRGSWSDLGSVRGSVRGRRSGTGAVRDRIDEGDETAGESSDGALGGFRREGDGRGEQCRDSGIESCRDVRDSARDSGTSSQEDTTPTSEASSADVEGFEMVGERWGGVGAVKTPPLPRRNPSRKRADSVELLREVRREGSRVREGSRAREGSRFREGSRVREGRRQGSRSRVMREVVEDEQPPGVKRVRVKLHAESDTRFLMIGPETGFGEMLEMVKGKLGISGECKVKMRDEEGDFVTVGDGEDWEMCLDGVRRTALVEWEGALHEGVGDVGELGKLDLWVSAL